MFVNLTPAQLNKGPVKLMQWVKKAHSFLQFVSKLFHCMLAHVALHLAVKEFFETGNGEISKIS